MPKSQWDRISSHLTEEIVSGKILKGDRLPSEVDLAARYRVSRPTANRAVQELRRLGYVSREVGVGTVVIGPRPTGIGQVAIVTEALTAQPQQGHIRGIQEVLGDPFQLLLYDTGANASLEARFLQRAHDAVDAIFCWPNCDETNTVGLQKVASSAKPLVCVDRIPLGLDATSVVSDNRSAVETAVLYLRARGHRRIAYFGTENQEVSSVRERLQSFLDTARDADVEAHVRFFAPVMSPALFRQVTCDGVRALTIGSAGITAIVCQQDSVLIGVLEACDALGLTVPGEIEIASFADLPPVTDRIPQQVHRLVQRAEEIGRRAARHVLARLDGEATAAETIRVPVDFYPALLAKA
jgi:GntR family transcriptional regulator of arabinose operon